MRRREGRSQKILDAVGAGLLFCVLLSSCAARTAYGIDLTAPSISEEVKVLARSAQAGDKLAQLELGKRFEAGRGVPKDLDRAGKLYAAAASPHDGASIRTFYSPSGGVSTTVLNGGARGGLPYAIVRDCGLAGAMGKATKSCDAIAGVDELLIFVSYDVNFSACAEENGFSTWSPNPLREVRNCLAAKAQTIPCSAVLVRPLLRAEGLSTMDAGFVGLGVAARNLRTFCTIPPPKSAVQTDEAMVGGQVLTPIDALIEAEHGRWRRHYERYTAEVFMVLMCKQTRPDVRPNLSDLEKTMCAAIAARGGKS